MPQPNWPQHVMPWEPGPIRHDVFRLGRYLGALGYTEREIRQHLARVHGEVRSQERTRAAELGARWGSRVNTLQNLAPDARIERSWMIRNNQLETAYRFTITFEFCDEDGEITGANTVLVTSSKNLTLKELFELGQATYAEIAGQYERFRQMPLDEACNQRVLLAERRSG
jgi:hypothetical protein